MLVTVETAAVGSLVSSILLRLAGRGLELVLARLEGELDRVSLWGGWIFKVGMEVWWEFRLESGPRDRTVLERKGKGQIYHVS